MTPYERIQQLAQDGKRLDPIRHMTWVLNMAALGLDATHRFEHDVLVAFLRVLGSATVNLHFFTSDHKPHQQGLDRLLTATKEAGARLHLGAKPLGENWARSDVRDLVRGIAPDSPPRDFNTLLGFWSECYRKYQRALSTLGIDRSHSALFDHAPNKAWLLTGEVPHDQFVNDTWKEIVYATAPYALFRVIYGVPFGQTCDGVVRTYSHSNYRDDMSRDDDARMLALAKARRVDTTSDDTPWVEPAAWWYRVGQGKDDRAFAKQHRDSALYCNTTIVFYEAPTTSAEHLDAFCDYVEGWCEK